MEQGREHLHPESKYASSAVPSLRRVDLIAEQLAHVLRESLAKRVWKDSQERRENPLRRRHALSIGAHDAHR